MNQYAGQASRVARTGRYLPSAKYQEEQRFRKNWPEERKKGDDAAFLGPEAEKLTVAGTTHCHSIR
jgi:hypothetical protein